MLKHVSFVTADADATAAFYTGLGAVVSKDILTAEGFRRLVMSFEGGGKLQFFELPHGHQSAPDPAGQEFSRQEGQRSVQERSGHPAAASRLLHPQPAHAWTEHIALHLSDLGGHLERLRAQGVTFTRELSFSPSGNPLAFVLDPDGRQVELLQADG